MSSRTPSTDAAPDRSASRHVLLGVTGGIAAYKAVELLRLLQQAGHTVTVLQTRASQNFVGSDTFAAVSGSPVVVDETGSGFPHLDAARNAGVLVVAPATANVIARMAAGIADDIVTTSYLGFDGRVIVCPAMNVRMWEHPATQRNVAQLQRDGVTIVTPEEGVLACGDVGAGRLADLTKIAGLVDSAFGNAANSSLAGNTIVVTAGGTREPIDAVREITNRSSGRMGVALAQAAAEQGAKVRLLSTGSVASALLAPLGALGVELVSAGNTTAELKSAVDSAIEDADMLIMAAAVSDFTVARVEGKLARAQSMTLQLEPTEDIIAGVATQRRGERPVLVAFAAESGEQGLARAHEKFLRKGVDAIVYNDVSEPGLGFEGDQNEVTLIDQTGEQLISRRSKLDVARELLRLLGPRLVPVEPGSEQVLR